MQCRSLFFTNKGKFGTTHECHKYSRDCWKVTLMQIPIQNWRKRTVKGTNNRIKQNNRLYALLLATIMKNLLINTQSSRNIIFCPNSLFENPHNARDFMFARQHVTTSNPLAVVYIFKNISLKLPIMIYLIVKSYQSINPKYSLVCYSVLLLYQCYIQN